MTGEQDFLGKKVTVVGLGIEGVDLVRYLVGKGAQVTVSDMRTADRLAPRLRALEGVPVRLSLGANDPADTAAADVVFVSQGVPLCAQSLAAGRLEPATRVNLQPANTASSGRLRPTTMSSGLLQRLLVCPSMTSPPSDAGPSM